MTNDGVLLQSRPLETTEADKPKGRHETVRGRSLEQPVHNMVEESDAARCPSQGS